MGELVISTKSIGDDNNNSLATKDGDEVRFINVKKMKELGFSDSDVRNLEYAGYRTVESVAQAAHKDLLQVKGLSETKVESLVREAKKIVPLGFTSASTWLEMRKDLISISTGSMELDRVLGGGIETGSITEIFGESGSGKSQLCHNLAAICQLPTNRGGAGGKCLWIDTENSFRSERILAVASRFNVSKMDVLENVVVARCFNSNQQLQLLTNAAALMTESRYVLLIVDSCIACLRSEYSGRGELSERQGHLNKILRRCIKMADEFGVAVVVTNQMVARVDSTPASSSSSSKAVGGTIMAHMTTTKLALRRSERDNRVARVVQSPSQPELEATFRITSNGIEDVV